jgi:probable DNA metabolism protein
MRSLIFTPTFAGWRTAARGALVQGLEPETLLWEERGAEQVSLPLAPQAEPAVSGTPDTPRVAVPRRFAELARRVVCHNDPDRWALLYRVLWRLTHGERGLLAVAADPDVHALLGFDAAVRRDVHKMRAFVRFRPAPRGDGVWHVAWFEPAHHIVELNAPFFVDRFASMRWSILTPERCAHWDGTTLTFTGGVPHPGLASDDAVTGLWRTYYGSVFNPARPKPDAMRAEMPKKYWKNLAEAADIPALLRAAPARVEQMMAKSDARRVDPAAWRPAPVPETKSLTVVAKAAKECTACPLYRNATQTVFGEGPRDAAIVLVGEQPGDEEDKQGHPFVGPSGRLLDRALVAAGIPRERCWVTNAVKHFKWEPRGKRRIHQTPGARDVAACRPWLDAELRLLDPQLVVCLGSTAAKAIMGPSARVTRDRGEVRPGPDGRPVLLTVHPSALLRVTDPDARDAEHARFVDDLRVAAEAAGLARPRRAHAKRAAR